MLRSDTNAALAKDAERHLKKLQEELEALRRDVEKTIKTTIADSLQQHAELLQAHAKQLRGSDLPPRPAPKS